MLLLLLFVVSFLLLFLCVFFVVVFLGGFVCFLLWGGGKGIAFFYCCFFVGCVGFFGGLGFLRRGGGDVVFSLFLFVLLCLFVCLFSIVWVYFLGGGLFWVVFVCLLFSICVCFGGVLLRNEQNIYHGVEHMAKKEKKKKNKKQIVCPCFRQMGNCSMKRILKCAELAASVGFPRALPV